MVQLRCLHVADLPSRDAVDEMAEAIRSVQEDFSVVDSEVAFSVPPTSQTTPPRWRSSGTRSPLLWVPLLPPLGPRRSRRRRGLLDTRAPASVAMGELATSPLPSFLPSFLSFFRGGLLMDGGVSERLLCATPPLARVAHSPLAWLKPGTDP